MYIIHTYIFRQLLQEVKSRVKSMHLYSQSQEGNVEGVILEDSLFYNNMKARELKDKPDWAVTQGRKASILVQTHKCPLLIMGLHIIEIKLC